MAWSIDGTCGNAVENTKTLVDFTNFSSNVTAQNVIDGLWMEATGEGCTNIVFVNSTGVGFEINFSCLSANDIGEYPLLNKKNSWYECEAISWNKSINPLCNESEKLKHYFNETDWMSYDFAVVNFDDGLDDSLNADTNFYNWRGENIFGFAQDDADKWHLVNTASCRFYETKFISLFDSSENNLYLSLSTTEHGKTGSYFKTDGDGNNVMFVNSTEFHEQADAENFIAIRWNFDSDAIRMTEDTYSFVLKSVKMVKKETKYNSVDCAVPMSIENITKHPYHYSGWIVNVTGSRVPLNIGSFDGGGDSLIYAYSGYGYYKIPREISFGIVDNNGWFLPVGELDNHIEDSFNATEMWEQLTITGKIFYGYTIYDVYNVDKSGNIVPVDYEEIPNYIEYFENKTDYTVDYFAYNNENLGCRFSKMMYHGGDYWFDEMTNLDYDYSAMDLFSKDLVCDYYGYGCLNVGIISYLNNYTLNDKYDLILLGGMCVSKDYINFFHPVGYAFDEYGLRGDGICNLEFESYKGNYEETSCRINPTFYALYLSDASSLFNPIVTGILGIILVGLTVLMFSGKLEGKWYMLMVGLLILSTFIYYTMVNKGLIAV